MSSFPERARSWMRSQGRRRPRRAAVGLVALGLVAAVQARTGVAPSGPTISVVRKDLILGIDVDGELASVHAVGLGPPVVRDMWEYKISFLAPEAAQVKKGDPIVGFDSSTLERQLDQKKAEYEEAAKKIERKEIESVTQRHDLELQLAEAESRLEKTRLKNAVPEELRSRNDVRQTTLDLADAERAFQGLKARIAALQRVRAASARELVSQRDRARARVAELQAAVQRMMVRAPQDGIVVYQTNWQNQKKKIGDSVWFGEKVVTLADLGEMRAQGDVDEADAGRIRAGQAVVLHVEALPDHDVTGRITQIARSVRRKSGRSPLPVFRVRVALDRTDEALRPAMRFRGRIEVGVARGVLVVPRDAVFPRPGGPIVWTRNWRGPQERRVTLGRADGHDVEVVAGLAERDEVSLVDLAASGAPS